MAADDFKEKLKSVGFSRSSHRAPRVTTDEHGNTTTEHWEDRVDVTIHAPSVAVSTVVEEKK